jgi:hypothetical protein
MKPLKPLPGQKPLFDECTPELVNYDGEILTQGVLFRPPESAGEPPPIEPIGVNDAESHRDSPRAGPGD